MPVGAIIALQRQEATFHGGFSFTMTQIIQYVSETSTNMAFNFHHAHYSMFVFLRIDKTAIRLIGSIAVTVPTCYYLAQQTPTADHGHSEHGDEHGGEHEGGEHEGEASEEETADSEKPEESIEEVKDDTSDENEESSDEKQDDKSDDSGDEGEKQQDTPDTSDDEESGNTAHEVGGGGNVEGVRFKGATKGGTKDGEQGDTRKHIPDAKGYNKKRIESDYGMKQGEVAEEPHVGDKVL